MHQACVACADDCLGQACVADLVKRIRLDQDCADVCVAAGRVTNRQLGYDASLTRSIVARDPVP